MTKDSRSAAGGAAADGAGSVESAFGIGSVMMGSPDNDRSCRTIGTAPGRGDCLVSRRWRD